MDKEASYSAAPPASLAGLDYSSLSHNHHHLHADPSSQQHDHLMKLQIGESSGNNNGGMVNYMFINSTDSNQQQQLSPGFGSSAPFDKLSFADVMQFADFGPKLALNQTKIQEEDEENGIDPVYFLKFPVLNDRAGDQTQILMAAPQSEGHERRAVQEKDAREDEQDQEAARVSDNNNPVQLRFHGEDIENKNMAAATSEVKNKRKRPRTIKSSEEVESQRMTHIAVERNRRKQMNEHLRVLRSLMPGSYVQRGDQASIIGGAIEFVRELEQLLQCLESQKRRRILGEAQRQIGEGGVGSMPPPPQPQPMMFPPQVGPVGSFESTAGLQEETAENKSCLADVEVKLLGFDAMIKILSRRRPGQLIKTIAALEDLHLTILHTNITTIEQTVLYSFNVKVASETRFTAEDIASSIQQIFSFIHANSSM